MIIGIIILLAGVIVEAAAWSEHAGMLVIAGYVLMCLGTCAVTLSEERRKDN